MKTLFIFAILLGLGAQAQILNPGFETAGANPSTAANWTLTQAAGGPVYGVRTNGSPRSGSWHFEARLASVGAGPVVEFAQTAIPVTGGTACPFTFYSKAMSGSAGYNAQWRVVWNAGGETGFRPFTPGNNAYAFSSNLITAPAAASSATLYFYLAGAASPAQSATIQIDDVSLGSTIGDPEPTNSFAVSIAKASAIRWFASNSVTYQVQWAAELSGENTIWNNLSGPTIGAGTTATAFDGSGSLNRVYRVLAIQQDGN